MHYITLFDIKIIYIYYTLLSKDHNFVSTPYDISWYTLKQDFDNFVDKLRFLYLNAAPTMTDATDNNKQRLDEPPPKKIEKKNRNKILLPDDRENVKLRVAIN